MRNVNILLPLTTALVLCISQTVHAQTYYYIDQISVLPTSPTTQDDVHILVSGNLSNTGSSVSNATAQVTGPNVALTVNSQSAGGLDVLVPHSEDIDLGLLVAGTYTITINGTGTSDFAPVDEHTFTVTGGPTACDSLVIASVNWAPFSDTAIMVHVFNPTSMLFDYPGFLLLDANGDTLAQEIVNFFVIAAENWHPLAVKPGAVIPEGTFSGTLELWTGFFQELACSWSMDLNLCPSATCSSVIPMIQNYGSGIATGSFMYHIQQGGAQVASGTLDLSPDVQYDSDTLCLAPGQYLMEVIPQQGPNGGQPHFGVSAEGSVQGPTASVTWTSTVDVAFTFYGPCADEISGTDERPSASLILARSPNGIGLARTDNKALGDLQVFDALGRTVTGAKIISGRWEVTTDSWPTGLYLIRSVGIDRQVLITRFVVE